MQSQDSVEDLHNRKHGKKLSIAFMKYFSKIIRQMKENAIHLLFDENRFSCSALIFPTSQQITNKIRVMSQPC